MGNSECLTDRYVDILADEIQREVDADVMIAMLEECGWYSVKLPRFKSGHHAVDIQDWIDENNIRDIYGYGSRFMFKHQQDATLFALKWL